MFVKAGGGRWDGDARIEDGITRFPLWTLDELSWKGGYLSCLPCLQILRRLGRMQACATRLGPHYLEKEEQHGPFFGDAQKPIEQRDNHRPGCWLDQPGDRPPERPFRCGIAVT